MTTDYDDRIDRGVTEMPKWVKGQGAPGRGACLMSGVNYLIGGKEWSDHPLTADGSPCVSPTIRRLGIHLNDWAEDEERQEYNDILVWEVMGTYQPEHEERRVDLCVAFALEMALQAAAYAAAYAAAAAAAEAAAYAEAAADADAALRGRLFDFIIELCAVGKEDRPCTEQVHTVRQLVEVAGR